MNLKGDDEKLLRTNLLNCYGTKTPLAFRVSKEHYRYLAEQIIATREHAKRLNAIKEDLFEALKQMLVEASAAGLIDAKDFGWPDAIRKAREAITRATGASS